MELSVSFIIVMLCATFCWFLSTIYQIALYNHYVKRIIESKSAKESCGYRKSYHILCHVEKIIFIVLSLLLTFCSFEFITQDMLNMDTPGMPDRYMQHPAFWFIWGISLLYYIVLMLTNTITNPTIAVSSKTKEVVTGDFVLFLRGFGCDNYLPDNLQANTKKSFFSEQVFCRCFSSLVDIIAIGRPEELISPSGASRVYLDNKTWREDVVLLMQKSKTIIILVNDKEHCIWEILQAEQFKEKTVYIINNVKKFKNVISILPMTHLSEYQRNNESFVAFYKNGTPITIPLENNKNEYWKVIKSIRHLI